jgi:hypothetical protein
LLNELATDRVETPEAVDTDATELDCAGTVGVTVGVVVTGVEETAGSEAD